MDIGSEWIICWFALKKSEVEKVEEIFEYSIVNIAKLNSKNLKILKKIAKILQNEQMIRCCEKGNRYERNRYYGVLQYESESVRYR